MTINKNQIFLSAGEGAENLRVLCVADGDVKRCSCYGKHCTKAVLQNLEIARAYNLSAPLWGLQPDGQRAGTGQISLCSVHNSTIHSGPKVTVNRLWNHIQHKTMQP